MPDALPIDPTLNLTIATSRLPESAVVRMGSRCTHEDLAHLRETLAAERSVSNGLSRACCELKVKVAEANATIAKLDATILFLQNENAEWDRELAKLKNEHFDLKAVIRKSMADHAALGSQYERGGNTRGSMQLRAVANLLDAILRGETPTTVCPAPPPSPLPVVSSSDPCPDCGSSRWTPNGDCPKCVERDAGKVPVAASPAPEGQNAEPERAGAIKEAAELTLWRLGQMSPRDKRAFCLDGVERQLMDALADLGPIAEDAR